MHIKRIKLKQIRCFEEIEIDFSGGNLSTLLLGDNGDGKSTILSSIAMGLCDQSSTAALFRELPGEFVRRKKNQDEVPTGESGFIEVDLAVQGGHTYQIVTKITSLKKFERVSQKLYKIKGNGSPEPVEQNKFPWERIFVSGYGPGVRTLATSDYQHYLAVDAVYPLFSYSSPLQNPELVIHRLIKAERENCNKKSISKKHNVFQIIQGLMDDLLDLDSPECFKLTSTGIKVSGHWGTSELSELGDGYKAVINWVMDLLSWWFLRENGKSEWNLKSLRGIVLIDEIEQHLHPKWQKRIFSRLREKFPNIQFIVATHSPLVASASKDVDVHLLSSGQHKILKPFGWLAEDMYEEMGLSSTRSIEFEDKILSRYKELVNKKALSKLEGEEVAEFDKLSRALDNMPESDPVGLSLEIQSITESLKKLREEKE